MADTRVIIFLALLGFAYGQDANCDFQQDVTPGQTYYVYNPGYSSNYRPGIQCRWIATCPAGYNCKLDCSEVNLPQTSGCSQDRLLISKSGDPQLTGAEYYCGRGSMTVVSTGPKMSVGLISANNSPGGRFICQLTAQQASGSGGGGGGVGGQACQCGWRRANRIVGGSPTGVNEYPAMAALFDPSTSSIKCGAVIIDQYYALTAAHCLQYFGSAGNTGLLVGEHDVTTGDSPATTAYRVSRFITHPRYNSNNYDYDVGIVELANPIKFSDRVGPVCLPFKFVNTDVSGAVVKILGWGTQFFGGPKSNVLLQTDVQVISNQQCSSRVAVTPRQMCTFTPGKDACQDDSGGPALYTDPSTGLLFNMGIISFGQFCANDGQPGINTRVTSVLDWITANTPRANYCRK